MHTLTTPAMPAAGDVDAATALAASFLEARRLKHGTARMDATNPPAGDPPAGDPPAGKTFSQEDVNRIVGEAKTAERAKFSDYADLKAKAEGSKTLEQRLADLDRELANERVGRIRTQVAAAHGIADLEDVLSGSTKEELDAAAKRIADRLKAGGSSSSSSTRTRTRRTVTETGGDTAKGLSKKEQAVEALRAMSGRRSSDD